MFNTQFGRISFRARNRWRIAARVRLRCINCAASLTRWYRKLWTPSSEYALDDPFWRLSVPTSEVGCFITSSRDIVHLDHRVRGTF